MQDVQSVDVVPIVTQLEAGAEAIAETIHSHWAAMGPIVQAIAGTVNEEDAFAKGVRVDVPFTMITELGIMQQLIVVECLPCPDKKCNQPELRLHMPLPSEGQYVFAYHGARTDLLWSMSETAIHWLAAQMLPDEELEEED